jgi:hypothetical protein
MERSFSTPGDHDRNAEGIVHQARAGRLKLGHVRNGHWKGAQQAALRLELRFIGVNGRGDLKVG